MDVFKGDLLDIDSLRRAFAGVDTLFLLNAVTGDEFIRALITQNVAREAGIGRVVYLSGVDADKAVNVPHFAVKLGAERMPETQGFSATLLLPAYFIDNEATIADVFRSIAFIRCPLALMKCALWPNVTSATA
ncbi:NmrA family NAD(P)-binding protein [Pantoea anthophila]|uniref:SDR family oxidoreductase n=1 Tax=Pantoea anthophila TaxID=470931 RepID=UPI002DBC10D3|nr:NmrA family NAD(P)-binding protein [Pantoea anthophila]MEB7540366.1 NmrA family NAD(P)-binding protein [Pantoea anthophila]